MPRISDREEIRWLLETDRVWAGYALGDLSPGFFEQCVWFAARESTALVLLFRGFGVPVLFTLGEASAVEAPLSEIGEQARMYLSVRPEILPLIRTRWLVEDEMPMWRMVLDPSAFRAVACEDAVRLSSDDVVALQRLYSDGAASGEAPDFFHPAMLDDGIFFGIYEDGELVTAAGTHLVAPTVGVGAIGNVYSRRDRRGRGLAARVTAAVTAELLRLNLQTVVLNVSQRNEAALRVYERLGFRRYCAFYEGLAVGATIERLC